MTTNFTCHSQFLHSERNKLLSVNINIVGICTYTIIGYDLKIKKNKVKQKKSALKSSMSKSMVLEYAV